MASEFDALLREEMSSLVVFSRLYLCLGTPAFRIADTVAEEEDEQTQTRDHHTQIQIPAHTLSSHLSLFSHHVAWISEAVGSLE